MTPTQLAALDRELECFLDEVLAQVPRLDQRRHLRTYVRGLLLDGERKSIEPLAARMARRPRDADRVRQRLQHTLSNSPWPDELLLKPLALVLQRRLKEARFFVIDDTGQAKKGTHSVGVSRQYSGTLGKEDNCQVHVSLHLSSETHGACLSSRLYLPESWADDAARRTEARVPADVTFKTKWQIALDLIDQALAWGVHQRIVLADADYGDRDEFRAGLRERRLDYVVQIKSNRAVWKAESAPDDSLTQTQRQEYERSLPPEQRPRSVRELALSRGRSCCRRVSWREGSKGMLSSSFGRLLVRPAPDHWHGVRPLPEVTLIYEWPYGKAEPTRYWLSTLPAESSLEEFVLVAKSRWVVERNYQDEKQEVGLAQFEGRSWRGTHRHYALCAIAHAFLSLRQQRFPPQETSVSQRRASTPADDLDATDRHLSHVPPRDRRPTSPEALRPSASAPRANVTR